MPSDHRELVSTASRVLAQNGHNDLIWGHASLRDEDNRGLWIKAAGWGMDEITPDRVHLLGTSGKVLEGEGEAHREYPIHAEIMAARPDVNGVVHVHSPFSVALAAAGAELRPVSHAANYFAPDGVPRFTQTGDLIVTKELGRAVAACLGSARAVFLVNHGIVTVGSSLEEATIAAIFLEMACQQQLRTAGFNLTPTWSDPKESIAKRERMYSNDSIRGVWDYLVRRLDVHSKVAIHDLSAALGI